MTKMLDFFRLRFPARMPAASATAFRVAISGAVLLGAVVSIGGTAMAQVQVAAKAEGPAHAALSVAGGKAAAQQGPIGGPVLGYLFDSPTLRMRPLLGIPGASYVGDPLPIGFTPQFVEVSPSQEYALGVEAESGDVYLIDLRSPLPAARRLDQATPGADRVFLSPLGKAAALYHREAKRVETLTGLPDEPGLLGRIDLASVPGMLTALAVSDDGKALAVAASDGESGSLFIAAPDGDLRLVGPVGRATALAFLNDADDLLVADAGRSEIVRIRNFSAGAEWTVLASRQDGIGQPVAVGATRDNTAAFAVSASDRRIARLPLNGAAVSFVDCPCNPTGLDALAPGSVFRLTAASDAPLYVLDTRPRNGAVSGEPRILFIPAADQTPEAGGAVSNGPRGRVRR
ncbi:MAG: hypothetical protein WD733_00485 [Bryobacterales bacterium]